MVADFGRYFGVLFSTCSQVVPGLLQNSLMNQSFKRDLRKAITAASSAEPGISFGSLAFFQSLKFPRGGIFTHCPG
jgi:hypothetical protein